LTEFEDIFEVISKGTELMKSMNFPKVIVKNITSVLEKAKVYNVILEVETDYFVGQIPALIFSSP
jgi:hypothetical protein